MCPASRRVAAGGLPAARPVTRVARFAAAAADPGRVPRLGLPEVAFAGRSNVGKSSLLNRLVQRRALARVSKTPGRTQQINFFVVDERLVLVDLPGYGFARVSASVREQWRTLVEHYLTRRRTLRAVVVIVDLRRGVEPDDLQLLDFLEAHRVPVVLAATKADKLAYGARVRQARTLAATVAPRPVVVCSAASGDGVGEVWRRVLAHCGLDPEPHGRAAGSRA
jgi:GTP-binding protein